MKNLRSILFVLAAILIVPAVRAQQNGIRADIPFDFVVGDRAYPAGEYLLKSVLNDGVGIIRIENVQDVSSVFVSSVSCTEAIPSKQTKLVFRRMAGRYFLYQAWTAGNLNGHEFPKGRVEAQMARNQEKPELVIVAANLAR
jgi:hypothetical protein